jgi:hypothetical protein
LSQRIMGDSTIVEDYPPYPTLTICQVGFRNVEITKYEFALASNSKISILNFMKIHSASLELLYVYGQIDKVNIQGLIKNIRDKIFLRNY